MGLCTQCQRGDTSVHRVRFMQEVLMGFSVGGLFERFVLRGVWEGASLPLEHYPFDCSNLTLSQVFSWVHRHGLAPGHPDVARLQSFAASWRNRREDNDSPIGQEFNERPRNAIDVLSWPDAQITSWRNLAYGVPCAGVTTAYPSFPALAAYQARQAADAAAARAAGPEVDMIQAPAQSSVPAVAPEDTVMTAVEDGEIRPGEIDPVNIPLPEDDDDLENEHPVEPKSVTHEGTKEGAPQNAENVA
ncbi:hypothetical protein C8R46DRAFT_1041797 [Mycena filopes]|nr:hypothetical protein C8R46DRAFT_1041797 [Mycena filopes]